MFKRAWIAALALGLTILAWSAWQAWDKVEGYKREKAAQRQQVAETQARTVYQCLHESWFFPFPSSAICISEVIQADADAERSNYDLQAQQEMAVWAYAMFLAGIASIGITGLGIILVAATLHEARKTTGAAIAAARAAEESVVEARKATNFTELAANVARDSLISADRAWIKIGGEITGPLVFGTNDILIKAKFEFRNIGKGPATHVSVFRLCMYADVLDAVEPIRGDISDSPSLRIVAGMGFGVTIFPNDCIEDERKFRLPTKAFKDRLAEFIKAGANTEEAHEVEGINPAILVGVRYRLPSDKVYRYTYLPFEIQSSVTKFGAWDGSECRVPIEDLVLRQHIFPGHVT